MRALFLDFDGVLHPVSAIADQRSKVTSADLPHLKQSRDLLRWLPILERALEDHPDVAIVVHSGWRGLTANTQMRDYLGTLSDRFIGITSLQLDRYEGIVEFARRADLDQYLILDDATHEFPAALPELVSVDPELGLTQELPVAQLRTWLDHTIPTHSPMPMMVG